MRLVGRALPTTICTRVALSNSRCGYIGLLHVAQDVGLSCCLRSSNGTDMARYSAADKRLGGEGIRSSSLRDAVRDLLSKSPGRLVPRRVDGGLRIRCN